MPSDLLQRRALPLAALPRAQLRLRLAGGANVVDAAGHASALAVQDALLLAWLALEGPTQRERMAGLLWPASTPEAARNALRQRLFRLRKQCGADVVAGGTLLALADGVAHDLLAGGTQTGPDGPGGTQSGLSVPEPGTLLGGLQATEWPALDDWLRGRRDAARAAARRHTEAQIDALEAQGDVQAALPLALAVLEEAPLSEDAHRRVMRLHHLRGDRAAALQAFDRCEQLLKHELGTRPSQQTLALLQTLESADDDNGDGGAAFGDPAPAQPPDSAGGGTTGRAPARAASRVLRMAGALVPVSVLRPPRMIGRDAELAALRRGWRTGAVVLVTGDAGIGKSRLLQALAREPDSGVVAAAGRPGDALVPYGSFARLLREVIARAPDALAGLADDDARDSLSVLLPGHAPVPPAGAAARQQQGSRRQSLVEPVRDLLRLAAAGPGGFGGLVFDDVHFADDASIELLQALLTGPREPEPVRWCLGLRPPQPGSKLCALLDALLAAAPLTQVQMQPLDVAQLAELVDTLALQGVRGADVAAALRQRSGGNPLFALETLKLAWADGALASGGELPRPQSLSQLIGLQLARLSPPALTLARVAAVAGADFALPLAESVLQSGALQLADAWHELETQQVMVGADFAHDLVCEAVLDGLPAIIARHLHGEIAALLEAGTAEPARVAAHWQAAGQPERALPSLRAAAERAHHALRGHERIAFLLRAADISEAAGDNAAAFDCVAHAVETHMNSIREVGGFPLLDRLDALAASDAQRARALGQRAWYCSQLADDACAVRVGEQALALAGSTGDRMLTSQIRQRLATALAMLGRFDDALLHLQAVQGWAEQQLPPDDLAEFHGNFAVVLDNLGRPEQAQPHHLQAIAASAAQADHAQQATQLANHAVSRLNAGDARAALQLVQRAQALVAAYSLTGSSAAFVTVLQLQCARAEGRYAEALTCADHAEAVLLASNPARVAVVQVHRGHCWLDLGQHARAGQALRAAGNAKLPSHMEARRLLLLARLQHALGQSADTLLDEAAAAAPPNGWPEVRMMVDVERALHEAPRAALVRLDAVQQQAKRLGLCGSVLAALLRTASVAAAVDGARAASAARAALVLAATTAPTLLAPGDVWLAAARGLLAGGDAAAARQAADSGRNWLQVACREHVAEPFRHAFLHRQPTHRDLLALSQTVVA